MAALQSMVAHSAIQSDIGFYAAQLLTLASQGLHRSSSSGIFD